MYGCESWTIKKAEHQRIDDFELWCWRRLLRIPWTARTSNQSILKISSGCSLEGLMLKLELQYFGHMMQRTDSFWKDPDAGQDRRWKKGTTEDKIVGWHHRLDGHEFEQALGVGDGQGSWVCCSPWGRKESDTTERLNWTENIYRHFLWVVCFFPTKFSLRFYLVSKYIPGCHCTKNYVEWCFVFITWKFLCLLYSLLFNCLIAVLLLISTVYCVRKFQPSLSTSLFIDL